MTATHLIASLSHHDVVTGFLEPQVAAKEIQIHVTLFCQGNKSVQKNTIPIVSVRAKKHQNSMHKRTVSDCMYNSQI